ncbi:MAG: LamG domain-containing protein, partial [Lentisphaeria bacterium]|nr:LamG domain-containing protein [Lentisphaeria bacterium]
MMEKLFTFLWLGLSLICGVNAAENNGLVLHLKLDEGTGNIAKDASGNGLDGSLRKIAWVEFGVQGKAVRFNGKNSVISLPLSKKLELNKAMTLSVWIKPEKFKAGMSLFSLGNYRRGWRTYVFNSFLAFDSADMKPAVVCRATIPGGTERLSPWYHVVYTLGPDPGDGGKVLVRIYMNGKQLKGLNTQLSEHSVKGPIVTRAKTSITLGASKSAEAQPFNGLMDEIKIYNRELTSEEVAAEYKGTMAQRAEAPVAQVPLKKIDFKPLKNTRIAVYVPLPEKWAVSVRSPAWFKEQAEKLGCRVTLLDDAALGNKTRLQKKNYDTLILPAGVMPFEAEDSVFAFLASGGNLLIPTVLPGVYRRNADGTFGKFNGKILKNHSFGWYAPFLLRDNPAAQADRKWISPLALSPEAVNLTGDLLPAVCGPFPKQHYRPLDSWNKQPNLDGGYGDGINYAQGADLRFDLYRERNGIPSDFSVYRYYNNLLYGATLVNLGRVGTLLLKGKDGDKVFQAVLRLMESRLPGEQAPEYYRNATVLHKEWSELGFVYSEAVAALRDAAYFCQLSGGEWKSFRDDLNQMEKEYTSLALERKAQQSLLVSGRYAESAKVSASLLKKVRDAAARYAELSAPASETLQEVKAPAKISVRHKYRTIPSIASVTIPLNLSRIRGRLFGNIRRIGSNVFSGHPFPEWYVADPAVREQLSGILRDHKFVYQADVRRTAGGTLNPGNGTVRDGKIRPYPEEKISNHLKTVFESW